MHAAVGPGEPNRVERVSRSRGDQLSTLTEVATLNILVALLRPLLHDDFVVGLHTQKAAGTLPQKRALFLYKVLGEVARWAAQLHTHQYHLLTAGRTGQLPPGPLTAMATVVPQCETALRHLAAALRAIHPAWGLKPQAVSALFTQWVDGSAGAHRFMEQLRWEIARQPGRAATWRHAFSRQLDHLLTELDANHRQIQAGLAAVRQFLQTEFVFAEEFFPK
jgi:hypothetical protein